ncbi:tripartite tricarboxylate transporter substrate binding protein [Comamonas sp. GB3 AK4-5]|uniref:tripartite tricarboxylate transporter substrate binding protein n=1 Tax=Comamonas sp. GB3 AK4-5 TaxID=3231487 RepID=UPI00351DC572
MKTEIPRRSLVMALSAACVAAALPCAVQAQEAQWPTKPVKLVVGYAAGGATDVVARLVAHKLGTELGQPIIVENRTGANSNVAAEVVSKSPADGYTLYVYVIANTINATLYKKLGYEPVKGFEHIGMIAKIPNLLVVTPQLPVKTVQDYIQFAKTSKDGITFASSGSGSSIHLSGEMFKQKTGIHMLHVPYRGSAPAITDLLGGQVQSMFDNAPSAIGHVKSGKLRAVAITSKERSPLLPDVPTVAESGIPGFEVESWFGLSAPAGTPQAIVVKANAALNKALSDASVRQRLADMGATASLSTPGEMRDLVASQVVSWRDVVKASGATVE